MVYEVLNKLETEFKKQPFVSTFTNGDIFDVDLNKKTIYPLTHLILNSWQPNGGTISYNVTAICMDLLDNDKNNKIHIWNQQSLVLLKVLESIRRGYLSDTPSELGDVTPTEFFTDRFENDVAGTTVTFSFILPNDMSIC